MVQKVTLQEEVKVMTKFYSTITRELYDSTEELEKAEQEYEEKMELARAEDEKKQAALVAKREERAAAAKEIEDAYRAAQEAVQKADDLLVAFTKKYGVYHASITTPSLKHFNNLFDFMFNSFWF